MELLFSIEIFIISALVVFEIFLALNTYNLIKKFEDTFKEHPLLKEVKTETQEKKVDQFSEFLNFEEIENIEDEFITVFETDSENIIQNEIISTINNYLINNRGAAIDFHIIKEVIERNIDSVEEEIEAKLPSPLYIGLAATMIGIIFGLFSINFEIASIESIAPLINGVKVAMFASIVGLVLTTFLSVFTYKSAKTVVDSGKNDFISLIQTDLLPSIMGPGQSGMSSLALKLDEFGRSTGKAVSQMNEIVKNSNNQVLSSQKIIQEIQDIDLSQITGANLKVLKTLSGMMDSFVKFPEYYNELNRSLGNTTTLTQQLQAFIDQTKGLGSVLEEIKDIIKEGRNSSEFFSQHIRSFEKYNEAVNMAVHNADEKMKIAISTLELSSENLFENIQKSLESYDEVLKDAFNLSVKSFEKLVEVQTEKLALAFKESRPRFEHLSKLTDIDRGLVKLGAAMDQQSLLSKATNDRLDILIEINTGEVKGSISGASSVGYSRKNVGLRVLDIIFKVSVTAACIVIIIYAVLNLTDYLRI